MHLIHITLLSNCVLELHLEVSVRHKSKKKILLNSQYSNSFSCKMPFPTCFKRKSTSHYKNFKRMCSYNIGYSSDCPNSL